MSSSATARSNAPAMRAGHGTCCARRRASQCISSLHTSRLRQGRPMQPLAHLGFLGLHPRPRCAAPCHVGRTLVQADDARAARLLLLEPNSSEGLGEIRKAGCRNHLAVSKAVRVGHLGRHPCAAAPSPATRTGTTTASLMSMKSRGSKRTDANTPRVSESQAPIASVPRVAGKSGSVRV
jgi:hypothetical protein